MSDLDFNLPEEAAAVSSLSQGLKKGGSGLLKVLGPRADSLETNELDLTIPLKVCLG